MIKVSQACTDELEEKAIKGALDYGYFGHTTRVEEFEKNIAQFLGAKNVVAVNTGTSALHLTLDALEIGIGDEVIVPSLTFVASFQAISATGAKPISCDILQESLLIDIDDIKKRITSRTKAIMPVHYAGNPCKMDELLQIGKDNNIHIVEDAAHAFGSRYKDRLIGSFGDITCFSFDSIKNITCIDGGAIICSNDSLANKMREKRILGIRHKRESVNANPSLREVSSQGYRYHMNSIHAAVGLVQLKKLSDFVSKRRNICIQYNQAFSDIEEIQTLPVDYNQSAPHLYVIRLKNNLRDNLVEHLKKIDIETSLHYPPNHLQPFYQKRGLTLPVTEKAYKEILSLPLHCRLSDKDVESVIGQVKSFFKRRGIKK